MSDKILEMCKEIVKSKNKTCYEICEKYGKEICCSGCPLQPTPSCDCLSGQHIMLAKQYIKDHAPKDEFNWEDFKNGKISVYCDTEEKAKDFMEECDKQGLKWCSGCRPLEYPEFYYDGEHGRCYAYGNGLNGGFLETFKDKYKIINWKFCNELRSVYL